MSRAPRGEPDLPPGPARELVWLFRQMGAGVRTPVGQIARRTGLSAGHVSDVLRGWKAPSPHTASVIARALGGDDRLTLRARRYAEDLAELNRYNRARARNPGRSSPIW